MSEPQPADALAEQDAIRPVETVFYSSDDGASHPSPLTLSRHEEPPSGRTDSVVKKSSPSKMSGIGNKLPPGMDISTSSLAAISARLMPQFTPAELEIARISREKAAKHLRLIGNGYEDAEPSIGTESDTSADSPSRVAATLATTSKSGGAAAIHDSLVAEEWVNLHLETSSTYLLPASDMQALLQQPDLQGSGTGDDSIDNEEGTFAFLRKGENNGPLARAGIDRWTLYRLGMPKHLVDRLYRALYVYTNGFHNIINEIASHCPPSVEKHVSSNVWLTFLLLLEQCGNGTYEMAMLKFKQATEEWRQEMHHEFTTEKIRLETNTQQLEKRLQEESSQSAHKSECIDTLKADAEVATATIAQLQQMQAEQTEQLRLLRLEVMVREDREKKLNTELDEVRQDFEVANVERFNALTERYALDEEMCKRQHTIERLETEKSNSAKRMHETLFMNQALRATHESLKHSMVVLTMDKAKVETEKQAVEAHVDKLEADIKNLKLFKAAVEHELVESTRRQTHGEERLQAMKEQLDAELENAARMMKEIATLAALIDEEKVKAAVLEATCNLLTAEKQNTGMRAQDKLRIERLLNQKLELENQIELTKVEHVKDQEQIWNLKASLEALDAELQQANRVYSAGQQAFLHSERTAEKVRNQLHDAEKNYEKTHRNLTSLRERFKMFEESSKEQVTKLEVELKVANAQLREVTFVNRENAALMADLTKTLENAANEAKTFKQQLDASETQFNQLLNEKELLQRDQQALDKQHSSSKQTITRFVHEVQGILALVKIDEYPLDEALREVLRMVKETFGHELDITKVLDEEDEPHDFEEVYDEAELAEATREWTSRVAARRAGFSVDVNPAQGPTEEEVVVKGSSSSDSSRVLGEVVVDEESTRKLTMVARMSKFRRTKLDNQVRKLQRDLETSTDFVRSLEGVVCTQAEEIAMLTATRDHQVQRLQRNEHQKDMLQADIEGYRIMVADARASHTQTHESLKQATIGLGVEINKTIQMEFAFQSLRRQFDIECATTEDLLSSIGRAYEHELLMRSLRRDKAVQATVTVSDQFSQTLVPSRNPLFERVRIPAMNLPTMNPTTEQAKSLLQQINESAKALLPNVSAISRPMVTSPQLQTARRPRHESPRYEAMANNRERGQRHKHRQLTAGATSVSPQLVGHYNEFGMRQDVLVSPVYPPYFPAHSPVPNKSKFPTKQLHSHAHRHHVNLELPSGDERAEVAAWDPRIQSVKTHARVRAAMQQTLPNGGIAVGSRMRYHRGFLQAGMEVLRGGGSAQDEEDPVEYEYDDEAEDDNEGRESNPFSHRECSWRNASKLELAVRDFHDEQDEAIATGASPPLSPSRYYSHRLKEDESRHFVAAGNDQPYENEGGEDDDEDDDRARANTTRNARFVPGVLYPLLPPQ